MDYFLTKELSKSHTIFGAGWSCTLPIWRWPTYCASSIVVLLKPLAFNLYFFKDILSGT